MPHPIDYAAREVNPANTSEFWPTTARINRGDQWNPHYVAGILVPSVQKTDEAKNLYRVIRDPAPPPQPGTNYVQRLTDTFVGTVNSESAYIQETITWEQETSQNLGDLRIEELRAHVLAILYDEARLSGLGGNDFWVPMNEVAQAVDAGHVGDILANGYPIDNIEKRIERIDTGREVNQELTSGTWALYMNARVSHFLRPLEKARNKVKAAIDDAIEADDFATLDTMDVKVKWSPVSAPGDAQYVDSRTFTIPGTLQNVFQRGTQVECQQPTKWVWGRVESSDDDGSITTVVLDFREPDVLANEALQVSADLWRYPEWRSWVPGENSSDPARVPV